MLLASSIVRAQQFGVPINALAGRDANQGVYVRDSAIAVEKLALAERMEHLKEWDKSADVYQEVVEKYADRIVPSQVDADKNIYQYTSVVSAVQQRLAKWPAEGRAVYVHKYEPAAASMLDAAASDDLAALHRVVSQYFLTDAGKTAALRLIDLQLEAGEFAAAAWLGDRLLELHPNLAGERAKIIYRVALAHHLSGDRKLAESQLAELKSKLGDATATIHGEQVKLADALAEELNLAVPKALDASADSWPMLGGAPHRGRVPEARGRPGAKIFDVPIAKGSAPLVRDPNLRPNFISQTKAAADQGLMLGVMPVVDNGELFFQDNARIYAVRLESNVPLPGWQATYGSDRHGQYVTDNATSMPRSVQLDTTVTDTSVIAVLGQLDRLAMANQASPPARESKLVCLDRETGKERWVVTPRKLPDQAANLRTIEFGGAPLVVGDNVYIAARGGKPMQFEDAYVLCFALADGKFRWSCYVASGSVPGEVFEGAAALSENISQLAYASGRLYVLTNLGAAAAIDAYRGTIDWLNIYPRPVVRPMDFQQRLENAGAGTFGDRPWTFNTPIVKDGKVFVMPADSDHLLIYDAGSGVEIKRIAMFDFDEADTLLGVVDEKLLIAGKHKLWCINWRDFDSKKPHDANLIWWSKQGDDRDAANRLAPPTIKGRGFVTTDSVLLPVKSGLLRFDLRSGRVMEKYPSSGEWTASEEEPGNVLVTQDHLIVAGMKRVSVYTDMALAKAKLDAEVAAAPRKPEPRLRYAEMMFVSGQYDLAVSKLDEAIDLAGGKDAMKRGPDRDRIFGDCLAFAQKLTGDKEVNSAQRADELFNRAAFAADSPAQQVQYRLARMKFADSIRDFKQKVQLCQEILSDGNLRGVAVSESPTPLPAGSIAEREIAELLKSFPEIYKDFDRQAADALTQAKQNNDANALLNIAQSYPNSVVAADAMLAAAQCFEDAKNPRRATQVLNEAYRRYASRSPQDRARLIEAQVRNYLALPNGIEIAIGRMQEASRLPGVIQHPIKLPDGTTIQDVSFTDALAKLRKYNAVALDKSLPDFGIPIPAEGVAAGKAFLPESDQLTINDVDDLLTPPREFARNDRVVTWTSGKGISIYAVGTTKPLGTSSALADAPLRDGLHNAAYWLGNRLLVASGTKAVMLDGENGSLLWESTLKSLAPAELVEADPNAEPEQPAVPPAAQLQQQQLAQIQAMRRRLRGPQMIVVNGQVVIGPNANAINAPLPRVVSGEEAIEHVRPAGDRIIVGTSTGRLYALDANTGSTAWQTRLTENAFEQVLATDDFVAVRLADEAGAQIVALDTSGQIIYRKVFNGGDAATPMNMALALEGKLVYTLADRLCIKDLFEGAGEVLQWPDQPDGNAHYAGATHADHLLIAEGRVLALNDNGASVRVHSLQLATQKGSVLGTGSTGDWENVSLRVVGPHLYIVTRKGVAAYNLDSPQDTWLPSPMPDAAIRDAFVGKNFVVLLDQMIGRTNRPNAGSLCRLLMYGTYPKSPDSNVQVGRIDYLPVIRNPAGIADWQGVDGGFYYRSGDRKLHYLRGAANAK